MMPRYGFLGDEASGLLLSFKFAACARLLMTMNFVLSVLNLYCFHEALCSAMAKAYLHTIWTFGGKCKVIGYHHTSSVDVVYCVTDLEVQSHKQLVFACSVLVS